VFGLWPIAMNTPSAGMTRDFPVAVSLSRSPDTFSSPRTSSTAVLVWISIFGLSFARSTMIRLARNSSRRWSMWTFDAKRVR